MKRFLLLSLTMALFFSQGISQAASAPSPAPLRIPFKPRWVTHLKKGAFWEYKRKEFSSPVIFDDSLFVGSDAGYVYRLNLKGHKIWRARMGSAVNATPALARLEGGSRLFIGDDKGRLHALDAADGKEIWKAELGSEIWSAAAVSGSKIFVPTMEGVVFALDIRDGRVLWKKEPSFRSAGGVYGEMSVRGTSDPVADDAKIYLGFADGTFSALAQSDGKTLWEKKLATQKGFGDVDMPPLILGDRIFVAGFEGQLSALSRKDGKTLWTAPEIGSAVKITSDDKGLLYVSGADSVIYAVEAATGKLFWKTPVGKGALTSAVVYKDVLAVGLSSGTMNFLETGRGRVLIRRFAKKGVFSNPVVQEDKLYYFSNGGRLYSLRFKE